MNIHKFLWLLIVLVFSVVACDSSSSTPTLLPPPSPTSPPVNDTPTPVVIAGKATIVRGTTYYFTFEINNTGEGLIPGPTVD